MHYLAATKANLVCWLVLEIHRFPREGMYSYLQLGVCCRIRTRRVLQLSPPHSHRAAMQIEVPQKSALAADISWLPPPLQKQSVKAAVLPVPKAIAGASGAYRVATAN